MEQSHYRFKDAVDQALQLRGSRDFGGASEYQAFLRNLLKERNAPSTKPSHKLDPFEGYLKQRIDPVCPNALSATVLMREMRLSPLPSCHQEVFACFGGGPEEFLYGKEALCGELKWVSIGASWQEQAQDAAEARKSL